MKNRRTFTPEERWRILQEAEREGRTETIRKHNLAPSLFDKWRRKYLNEGRTGLNDQFKRNDPVIKELELENERLKRIVTRQAIELEVKTELLKKTFVQTRIK